MEIVSPLLCLLLIVVLAVVMLVILSLISNKQKVSQALADKSLGRSQPGWKNWLPFFAIALILAFWSIFAALFFLAVVWILRRNPKADSLFAVSDRDKSAARRVYTWLFLSSFITVPFFLIMVVAWYSRNATNNRHVLTALIPLIFHLPLLLGLSSKSAFVYRHTQQGILLVALRAAMAALAISIGEHPDDGLSLFLFGNGALWLFGSIWGWTQVSRGQCWWMKQKGEAILPLQGTDIASEVMREPLSPLEHLVHSKAMKYDEKDLAREHALAAFRLGSREIKRQAVQVLDDLGEVESF